MAAKTGPGFFKVLSTRAKVSWTSMSRSRRRGPAISSRNHARPRSAPRPSQNLSPTSYPTTTRYRKPQSTVRRNDGRRCRNNASSSSRVGFSIHPDLVRVVVPQHNATSGNSAAAADSLPHRGRGLTFRFGFCFDPRRGTCRSQSKSVQRCCFSRLRRPQLCPGTTSCCFIIRRHSAEGSSSSFEKGRDATSSFTGPAPGSSSTGASSRSSASFVVVVASRSFSASFVVVVAR
mmetsp:Transcript_30403/g.98005  ORF Transcript_30403/g.98005 Transcript_30403/m.98005 type:complete len:233 (-) Transcript_30403:296-994(-)